MEFLKVDTLAGARDKLLASMKGWLPSTETVTLDEAHGRILSKDILAPQDIPAFKRSSVDGYALFASDTSAAGESIPVFLAIKGRVEIGIPAAFSIQRGECAEVPTGGMLPGGANAVAMVEYTEPFGAEGLALYASVADGENVVQIGEDARAGGMLLRSGRRVRPQDIGVLAAAGITTVPVYTPPCLTILSTGDELLPPEHKPSLGQVRDINTPALTALARKSGFIVVNSAVLPDDESMLKTTIQAAMQTSDIIAVSGGSSKGPRDMTRAAFDRVASPGVFTHGIAIKPGKPTILALDVPSRTVLIGLPGHPVSAMVIFELLLGWLFRELTGCAPEPAIPARIACNAASAPGKLTCWPVALEWTGSEYVAHPVFGKSGLITTLSAADGYCLAERDREGLQAGEWVSVHLF